MILISNKNMSNLVYIPENIVRNTLDYTLTLRNRASNKEYEFAVQDRRLVASDFHTFAVDFSDVPVGEYEYELLDGDCVGKGIIKLCVAEKGERVYEEINSTYTVYEQ